ncbi:MAG: enoyl-CoA hydratase/isomerase family protein [Alphaproteobacteria bacterium]
MIETPGLEIDGAVATVTLQRVKSHNALEVADLAVLADHFAVLAANADIRVVVLTGAGEKTFCAGASLGDVSRVGAGSEGTIPLTQVTEAFENLPQLTICALNGSVYGGGVELAMAADFRLGIKGMRCFVPPARFGIHYPASGIRMIATRLGLQPAKRLLLAAETLETDDLIACGFCDWWVEDRTEFDEKLAAQVADLTSLAPLALKGMKQALNDLANGCFDAAQVEAFAQMCWRSQDFQEGLAAKAEGRAPNFKGI